MAAPQSYKNHARFDPPMHFFVFPLLMINVGVSIYVAIHYRHEAPFLGHWTILLSLALLVLAVRSRMNDLKNQDRIIRVEERIRFAALLPAEHQSYIDDLTLGQIIALRFASNEELASLVHTALIQNLEPKAIKQRITLWRADDHRV